MLRKYTCWENLIVVLVLFLFVRELHALQGWYVHMSTTRLCFLWLDLNIILFRSSNHSTHERFHLGYVKMLVLVPAGMPLRILDFSGNSLRRLAERLLTGLQHTLEELHLADNLLGDSLNPIFSSSELHGLSQLRLLNLSGNMIKAVEEGLLKGCLNLRVRIVLIEFLSNPQSETPWSQTPLKSINVFWKVSYSDTIVLPSVWRSIC